MVEDEGRCVDEANNVVPSRNRLSYTMSLGATAKQCLQKCRRQKGTAQKPKVYGCEYQSFAGGKRSPKCEAITDPFKGGDGRKTSAGNKRICWTLLTQQTITDYLKVNRNPWYCKRTWFARSPGCIGFD